jgi:hypothetical protein
VIDGDGKDPEAADNAAANAAANAIENFKTLFDQKKTQA